MANYYTSMATNCHFRPSCRALWHDTVSTTPESTLFQIESDIVAFAYDFIQTGEYEQLLYALRNAKFSKHSFSSYCISGDEETFSENYNSFFKLFFNFSDDKSKVFIKCTIRIPTNKTRFCLKAYEPFKQNHIKYRKFWEAMHFIEEAYAEL